MQMGAKGQATATERTEDRGKHSSDLKKASYNDIIASSGISGTEAARTKDGSRRGANGAVRSKGALLMLQT